MCFNCKKYGYPTRSCLGKDALHCGDQEGQRVYRSGLVEGKKVNKILLDTGCSRTMVHKTWVPPHKLKEGNAVTIRCAHGNTVLYPLADVNMEVDGLPITVEAAVSETLPAAVLLGTGVPELTRLLGRQSRMSEIEDVMVVTTQAQARQQLEEEILRREKEVLSGARSTSIVDMVTDPDRSEQGEFQSESPTVSKEQRQSIRQQFDTREGHGLDVPALTSIELRKIQDLTLTKVKEATDFQPSNTKVGFFRRDAIIYWR